jgi:glutaredoxin 3
MKPVTIYTTPICGYCRAAKHLLSAKGVAYEEIDVMAEPARRREMTERAGGRRTVPQIFVGETHVGGYDDLAALDRQGRLDALLAG